MWRKLAEGFVPELLGANDAFELDYFMIDSTEKPTEN